MIIYEGRFSFYDDKAGNVAADNEMMTLIFPSTLQFGEPARAIWQWSQKGTDDITKVNSSVEGFIDGMDQTSQGELLLTFCRHNTLSFEAVRAVGADFSKLQITLRAEDHIIDPNLQKENKSFTVKQVYRDQIESPTLRAFWMAYTGKLNLKGRDGRTADNELIILTLPCSFEEGDPVEVFSQWTSDDGSGEKNVDFRLEGTVSDVSRTPGTDDVSLKMKTVKDPKREIGTIKFGSDISVATLTLSIEGRTSGEIRMQEQDQETGQEIERGRAACKNDIVGRLLLAQTGVLNDSSDIVWVSIADAAKDSRSRGALVAAVGVTCAFAAIATTVIAPPAVFAWSLNCVGAIAAADGVYAMSLNPDDPNVSHKPLFPGTIVARKVYSVFYDKQDVTINWFRVSNNALEFHQTSTTDVSSKLVRVSDIRSKYVGEAVFKLQLSNIQLPTYHALVWMPGFTIVDSSQSETAPVNLLKKPTGSIFSQGSIKKGESTTLCHGILYSQNGPSIGFGAPTLQSLIYNLPVADVTYLDHPRLTSIHLVETWKKRHAYTHHTFLRLAKYKMVRPKATQLLGTADTEAAALALLEDRTFVDGYIYSWDPVQRQMSKIEGYPATLKPNETKLQRDTSSQVIHFIPVTQVNPIMGMD